MYRNAIGKKLEKDKYFFVFRQQYLPQLRETKFAILDEVKSINVGNEIPVTLSIGVGAGTDSFAQAYERAQLIQHQPVNFTSIASRRFPSPVVPLVFPSVSQLIQP